MILLLLLLLLPFTVNAVEPQSSIKINEFVIEPNNIVELANFGTEEVDISGWHIDDEGGSSFFTIPSGTIIQGNSCLVINGNFNLNKNSPDNLRLFIPTNLPTSSNSTPIAEYSYTKSPGIDYSFGRDPDLSGDMKITTESIGKWNSNGSSCVVVPTLTPTITIQPTPVYTPTFTLIPTSTQMPIDNIYISEAMTAPDTHEVEWVELFNNNTIEVELNNWYLDDIADGGSSPKIFSLKIPPKSYATTYLSAAIFNNSGDTIRLLDSEEKEIDLLKYTSSIKGYSIGWKFEKSIDFCFQRPSNGKVNNECRTVESTSSSAQMYPITPKKLTSISYIPSISPKSNSKKSINSKYIIIVTPPVLEHTIEREVLGAQSEKAQPNTNKSKNASLLAAGYSLLSILSLSAKMKFSHYFS